MISAEISDHDIMRLRDIIERGAKELGISAAGLVQQATIIAIQRAAKETGPGNASSPSKLEVKYKYREIVRETPGTGTWFKYRRIQDGKDIVFETKNDIKPKTQRKRGLQKLTRSVRVWSKKQNQFILRIYSGSSTKKTDKDSRIGRIPHYGAAKAGWLKALGRLPGSKPLKSEGDRWVPNPRISVTKQESTYQMVIENVVRYVDTISPHAAAIAMRKTINEMEHSVQRKIDKLSRRMNL